MVAERDLRERDILVASNESAYVQDLTKGDIVLYVGPTKISLSNTERLVEFRDGRFVPVKGEESGSGVYPFVVASSSQYVILENPPKDPSARTVKGSNSSIELLIGKKVVVPGPVTFPLWPGQRAQVIDGHQLREDQYLVVRVYDQVEGDESAIGSERIVQGSAINFYIPKTGLEVVPEEKNRHVRTAVTLLDGEYCILLAPKGQRKYVRGSCVVFPEPMEEFFQPEKTKVFKAHLLRKNMGLHVRVVKDFEAHVDDRVPAGNYAAGQEIFLKDLDGFFFPSENLAVVGEVQAVPIAEKEGMYVRDIETGKISTEIGPQNYLLNPTKFEMVTRQLDTETLKLYGLKQHDKERAVSIYIPPSYAVLVMAKNGREMVRGPLTKILAYDEDLEVLTLSTGKPKADVHLLSTCFLQVDGNRVSDIIKVKTNDHVELELMLSYRVSFYADEGQENDEKWFHVKNYVGLLCEHLGSIVRAAVRATSIEEFHAKSTQVVRSAILGEKHGDEKRTGRRFNENCMLVYDVEVLDVKILDVDVKKLLSEVQRSAIVAEVNAKQEQLRLTGQQLKESVDGQLCEARITTVAKQVELEAANRQLSEAKALVTIKLDELDKVGHAENGAKALEISTAAEVNAAVKMAEVEQRKLEASVEAYKQQMAALSPELIATLKMLGNQHLAAELSKNGSLLSILGGESAVEVVERLLKSLPIGVDAKDISEVVRGPGK